MIERETMESHFPQSKSSYTHFKDAQVCSGNLHCIRLQSVTEETPLLTQITEVGKSPLRQASIMGYDTLFFLMLRQLTLKDAQATVCKRLGIKGRALISPYPEIGMDVDKPFRLENLREYLTRHHERHTPGAE